MIIDITFYATMVKRALQFQVDDEVDVIPHVVLKEAMVLE